MQAIILATGERKKLAPLTVESPSPMLPIANRPVMSLAVELLARQGFKEILVSLYEQGGSIESYFASGSRWGVDLRYSLQREARGSAGALKWAAGSWKETAVILPADAIIDVNIAAASQYHQNHGQPITAILAPAGETTQKNLVWLGEDGHISLNSNEGRPYVFTGGYIINPETLTAVPPRASFEIDADLIPALLAEDIPIHGYKMDGYWNPLNTFSQLQSAQKLFLESAAQVDQNGSEPKQPIFPKILLRHPIVESVKMGPGIWVGKKNVIHPTARLTPPVYIGDDCRIGHDVELGPNVVIGSHSIIDDEATIRDSVIFDYTYVGQLVEIENRIVNKSALIDLESEECTEVTDAFLLSEASPTYAGDLVRRNIDSVSAFLLLLLSLPVTALLSLILLLTRGKVWQMASAVGLRPLAIGPSANVEAFALRRFNTRRDDGSLTKFGHFLEQWNLARLPELWNVFRGDMSLVGVKPITPNEAAQVTEAWQEQRFNYPAGFTGLWYVQTTPQSSLDESLMADTYYVATRSWREDVRILMRTPLTWFRMHSKSRPSQSGRLRSTVLRR